MVKHLRETGLVVLCWLDEFGAKVDWQGKFAAVDFCQSMIWEGVQPSIALCVKGQIDHVLFQTMVWFASEAMKGVTVSVVIGTPFSARWSLFFMCWWRRPFSSKG